MHLDWSLKSSVGPPGPPQVNPRLMTSLGSCFLWPLRLPYWPPFWTKDVLRTRCMKCPSLKSTSRLPICLVSASPSLPEPPLRWLPCYPHVLLKISSPPLLLSLVFRDRVSLRNSPSCPVTHFVDDQPASASWALGSARPALACTSYQSVFVLTFFSPERSILGGWLHCLVHYCFPGLRLMLGM